MAASNPFIVIVDDDESVRDSLKSLLRSAGYRAVAFSIPEPRRTPAA
jgi:FixJ family two-component response regulator